LTFALTGTNLLTFLITGLSLGGIYALSALGLVVVYRATGILNFAQGAVGELGAMLLTEEFIGKDRPEWLGYIAALAVSVGLSLVYGWFFAPKLAHREPVVKALGTLGFALMLLGFCGWRWPARIKSLSLPTDDTTFKIGQVTVTLTRVIIVALAVAVTLGITVFLNQTRVGLQMRSLANDRELSSMLGVRVRRAEAVAWFIAGLLGGITGLLFAAAVQLSAPALTFLVIPAIAAAIVGQLRSLTWTLAGGIIIGVVEGELTNFRDISPYKGLTQLVVATAVILWLQRKRVFVMAASGAG